MNESIIQFGNLIKSLPLSKKISMVFIICLVITGFVLMFFLANQENYQVLYNNLSPEDGGTIVSKLKEKNIPYKVEANGTIIMVPAETVYEVRLSLAGEGLPHGGNVGFEIFDKTDFGTTRFVQELNYQRALQGELARTINQFKEVKDSKVFIVMPKASIFVEDQKPATASIQLDLTSNLPPSKLTAIVHLVANAVEGLEPDQVTVVDTKGRLIFKGENRDDGSSVLSNSQLEYKKRVENEIKENVQSMLEGIAGPGKAIVRVYAEIDFDKITLNQEEYDPSARVVRSERNIEELSRSGDQNAQTSQGLIDQQRGVIPSADGAQRQMTKKDVATNYEINRTVKTVLKPAGTIQRLSVAAVIDGNYKVETLSNGSVKRNYIPRTEEELKKFEEIVKKAMGYSEDREDQVSVSSLSFSEAAPITADGGDESTLETVLKHAGNYKKTIINFLLVAIIFLIFVRPLLKSMKNIAQEASTERRELVAETGEYSQIPQTKSLNQKEKIYEITRANQQKAQQLINGWISEQE